MSAVPENLHDIPPHVARRAVEWLVDLQSGNANAALRRDLQDWLKQDAMHARAWQRIESVNASLQGFSSPTASAIARATLTAPRSAKRRAAVKTLAAFFFVGGSAFVVEDQLPWRQWSADERTAVGELRTIILADGTELMLNTDTAVNVQFNAQERRVLLVSGEIMITTGKDAQAMPRPFVVETAQGELRPLGTRFAVRQQEQASRLDVFAGAVEIRPWDNAAMKRIVLAGQQAQFTRTDISDSIAITEEGGAWTEGMIIASGMRLQDFLSELSRYRRGRLSCDPAIADLRVSGTYPLNDTDKILSALRKTLPIDVHFLTRYWVTVRATQAS